MGKTWRREKTQGHERKVILKKPKYKKIHTLEDYEDDRIQQIRPEETSNLGQQTPKDSKESSR